MYLAINSIAKEVAGLTPNVAIVTPGPIRPFMERRHIASRILDERLFEYSLKNVQPHEQIRHLPPNHKLAELMRHPNCYDTCWTFWYQVMMFLELTGNSYIWCPPSEYGIRSGNMQPHEMWVIPAHWVWPRCGPNRITEYYEIRPIAGLGGVKFPPDEVIHLRYPSPLHYVDGYSAQRAGSETIDQLESTMRARFWSMKNGAFPGGVLEFDADYQDPDKFDMDRIYAQFFARMQGENKYGMPLIMPPGGRYTPLTVSPNEMAYLQTNEQLANYTLALWGVPKEVCGLQDAGSEVAMYGPMKQFTRFCLVPRLKMMGQELTARLAMRFHKDARIWWNDPSPLDPMQVNADIQTDMAAFAISPNEVRAMRGRQPWGEPGADRPQGPPGVGPIYFEDMQQAPMLETAGAPEGTDLFGTDEEGPSTGIGNGEQVSKFVPALPVPLYQERFALQNGHGSALAVKKAVKKKRSAPPQPVNVTVNCPEQKAGDVTVNMPAQKDQPAPIIHMPPQEKQTPQPVNVTVNVPEQPAAIVNVPTPVVHMTQAPPPAPVEVPDLGGPERTPEEAEADAALYREARAMMEKML